MATDDQRFYWIGTKDHSGEISQTFLEIIE